MDGSRRPVTLAPRAPPASCEGDHRGSAADDHRFPRSGRDRVRRSGGRRRRARSAGRQSRPDHVRRARRARTEPRGRARRARHRRRRAGRDPVAERGPLPRRALRCPGVRAGPRADQLPAQPGRGRVHRRALGRVRAARRSGVRRSGRGHPGEAPLRPRRRVRRRALPAHRHPQAGERGRARDGDDQLHLRHHRPAQGRADDAPQPLAQRGDVRLAHGRHRSRRLPAHAADVPLQRLGPAVRDHRHGRAPRDHPQDRRRRHPRPGRTGTGDVPRRRAGGRGHDARRGRRAPRAG